MRAIRKLLEDLDEADNYDCVDNIIIYTETWEQHIVVLDEVLSRLAKAGFTARPTKCVPGAVSIEVVSRRISDGVKGLHEDNVVKISQARRPRKKSEHSLDSPDITESSSPIMQQKLCRSLI